MVTGASARSPALAGVRRGSAAQTQQHFIQWEEGTIVQTGLNDTKGHWTSLDVHALWSRVKKIAVEITITAPVDCCVTGLSSVSLFTNPA